MLDPTDGPTQRSHARVGRVLREKWQIDRLIGIGGMAAVYAATHVKNGRRVALKVLHPEASMSPDTRARFLREGYAANKIEHPGTVQVLDDDVAEDGAAFLVMELLEGESLEDRRERTGGKLPVAEVLRVGERVLDTLAVAHDKGVVHRDLKPDNIFLCNDGAVKLLDFGIARVREASSARHTMTNAGAMGTPGYMPPEQARGRWDDVGPRTDLWAVGATLFTVLTGRLVHQAETPNELLLAAMTRQAPPLASLLPDVPPDVATLVDRALAREIEARWPDARAMLAALQLASARAPAPRASMPSVTERPPVAAVPPPAFVARPAPLPQPPAMVPPAPPLYAPMAQPAPFPPAFVPPQRAILGPGSPGMATGHPVTVSPALAPAAPGPRSAAGPRIALLFGAVLAGGVVMGGLLWLLLGSATVTSPEPRTAGSTEVAALAASASPSAATSASGAAIVPSAEPTAPASAEPTAPASAAPEASSAAKPAASAPPPPKKAGAKPPSVQDLLNRRR
jgi:serine/threonine-protein kinase